MVKKMDEVTELRST